MAISQGKLAGTAFLTVDGENFMLEGDLSWSVAQIERETMIGLDGIHGFKEKPRAGYIQATLRDSNSLTVADFQTMTDVTVVIELASGKLVSGRNGWTVSAVEVKSEDATLEVRFDFPFIEEIQA